jgi:hypothetical protein
LTLYAYLGIQARKKTFFIAFQSTSLAQKQPFLQNLRKKRSVGYIQNIALTLKKELTKVIKGNIIKEEYQRGIAPLLTGRERTFPLRTLVVLLMCQEMKGDCDEEVINLNAGSWNGLCCQRGTFNCWTYRDQQR